MIDKFTMARADVSMAVLLYPVTKLIDAVWKPSQESLDNRLRFYTSLAGDGSKSSILFVKDALKKGANPDIEMQPGLPLIVYTARKKLDKFVRVLGDAGANLNAKDKHGDTALINSAYEGEVSTVEYLLGKNAKIDAKTLEEHGPTAVATVGKASPGFNIKAAIAQDNAPTATVAAPKQALTANM